MTTLRFSRYGRSSSLGFALLAALLLSFAVPACLEAQEGSVRLTNETEHLFVYVAFTEEEWQQLGAVLWISDPAGLFERASRPLGYVPSGGVRRQPLTAAGTLAGYLMDPDSSEWSLLRISSAPGEGVTVSSEAISDRRLPADQLPSLEAPILLDGRFADWEPTRALTALSRSYEPERFIRERRGERRTLPIAESRGWDEGGTRLEELKAVPFGDVLYLFLRWRNPPVRETELLLYMYGVSPRRPLGTLLIDPAGEREGVELYRPGSAAAGRVGNFLLRQNALEGEIRLDEIALSEEPRFAVISTLYRADSWYEEFPITRIDLGALLE